MICQCGWFTAWHIYYAHVWKNIPQYYVQKHSEHYSSVRYTYSYDCDIYNPLYDITVTRFHNVSGYPLGINRNYLDLLSSNLKVTTNFFNLCKSGLETSNKDLHRHYYNTFDWLSLKFDIFNSLVEIGDLNEAQFLLLNSFNTYMMCKIYSMTEFSNPSVLVQEVLSLERYYEFLNNHAFWADYSKKDFFLKNSRFYLNSDFTYSEIKYLLDDYINPHRRDLYCGNYFNQPLVYYESDFTNYNYHSYYAGLGVIATGTCCLSFVCVYFLTK